MFSKRRQKITCHAGKLNHRKIHEAIMAPKKGLGPLTDEEVETRMRKLTEIITNEAQKEINLLTAHCTEDIDESKKTVYKKAYLSVPLISL